MDAKRVLKIWAPWCQPCSVLSKVIEDLEHPNKYKIESVNSDEEINRPLLRSLNVRGLPTMIVLDSNNQIIQTRTGIMSAREVCEMLDKLG